MDPDTQLISRVSLPVVPLDVVERARPILEMVTSSDKCRAEEILSCGAFLNIQQQFDWADAYCQEQHDGICYVLFVGDASTQPAAGPRPGFRIGVNPLAGKVKPTVYFGRGLLVRYSAVR